MTQNPRVFVSHSKEDNDRFVVGFGQRLRAKGVEAWLDFWELLPGDSLVDKIFNEGLKNCQAFIIVLSRHSVHSKWVREELNTAIVKRIEENARLLAVRLDECEVPEALRSIVWIDVSDVTSYDREFERIVNSIYRQYERPPLGDPPHYVGSDILKLDELTRIDSAIFERACRIAIEQGDAIAISGKRLVAELGPQGISEEQIVETEEVLESRGYIVVHRVMGPPHAYDFNITTYGFDRFAHVGIPRYGELCADIARCIVRTENASNRGVAQELNQPIRIVEHVFESLAHSGLIKYTELMGGGLHMSVHWISPELRRKLEMNEKAPGSEGKFAFAPWMGLRTGCGAPKC
jgi:hypothetical protein